MQNTSFLCYKIRVHVTKRYITDIPFYLDSTLLTTTLSLNGIESMSLGRLANASFYAEAWLLGKVKMFYARQALQRVVPLYICPMLQ